MQKFRILSCLLALLCLIPLSACSSSNDSVSSDSTSSEGASIEASASSEAVSETAAAFLPDRDYEGREFVIVQDGWPEYDVFYDSALTGEIVDDAAYYRNLTVSEKYDLNITYKVSVHTYDVLTNLTKSIQAGDGAWDLVSGASPYIAIPLAQGVFSDLANMEYIDLSRQSWCANINDDSMIAGRLYMGTGYFDMPTVTRAEVVFFNSDVAENYGLGNLYQLVGDGSWTFDKLSELAAKTAVDLDGNGVWDETDQYGLTAQYDLVADSYLSSGYSYVKTDEDGNVTLSGYDDRFIEAGRKIYNILNGSEWYYSGYTFGEKRNTDNMFSVFTGGRSLFLINMLQCAQQTDLRDMGTYGILPTPKFTEDQESYGSVVAPFSTSIPADVKDAECSAIIFQALSDESFSSVLPAYYDIALSNKYLNDEESIRMLDLISHNTVSDFIYLYGEAAAVDIPVVYSFGLYENYPSWYASNEAKVNQYLSDFIENVKAFVN